jgi:hypothetical protein
MALPDRVARSRRGLGGRWRLRRQLAGISRSLAKDAALAGKFAMFNALTKGEPLSGAEPPRRPGRRPRRLPKFGWPLTLRAVRNGPARKTHAWWGRVVAIAAMATVIVGTLLLSSLLRPTARTCLMLASAGSQASAAPAKAGRPTSSAGAGQPVGGLARGPGTACPAYPAKK